MRANRSSSWTWIRISAGILILAFVFCSLRVRDVLDAWRDPRHPGCVLAACGLFFVNMTLQWIRWHFLVRILDPNVLVKNTWISFLIGMSTGAATPGRIGEIGRVWFIPEIDRWDAFGLVVLEKAYAVLPIVAGGLLGLVEIGHPSPGSIWFFAAIPSAAVLAVVVFLSLHPRGFFGCIQFVSRPFLRGKSKVPMAGIRDRFRKFHAWNLLILSSALYMIYILQFMLLVRAFGDVEWRAGFSASAATILAKTIFPVAWGDLGIREGAAMFFFGRIGTTPAAAFNGAFLLFVINVLIPALCGLLLLLSPAGRIQIPGSRIFGGALKCPGK